MKYLKQFESFSNVSESKTTTKDVIDRYNRIPGLWGMAKDQYYNVILGSESALDEIKYYYPNWTIDDFKEVYLAMEGELPEEEYNESFTSKITGLEKNDGGIYKIDQYDLNDFLHYEEFYYDYPGRDKFTTVIGQSDAEHVDYLLDENKIEARVYLGPRFHRGRDAVSFTVVYKTEEDKKKGHDIIKRNTSFR